VYIQRKLGKADEAMQSAWTKGGHDIMRECKAGLTKPKVVTESPMRVANGKLSGGTRERLQAFADHLGKVFNTARPVDVRVLGKLAPCCGRPHVDSVPTPREIHIAIRRLRDSAGGIDGVQARALKCLARDDQIFFDFVVEMVVEFWETQRLPAGWEDVLCTMLFKKGDATKPGNYRPMMLIKVAQKLVLIIIGNRLETLIESLDSESQRGFRGGRGTRDAIFTMRLLLRKRKEHQQEPWAVFIDSRVVKAFDTVNRDFLWAVLLRFGCPESFVDRLRVLHKDVIVVLRKDGEEVRLRSEGGVRQGDILGPPLFLIFVAMVCVVREVEQTTPDVTLLTCPHERVILHGRKGEGEEFSVNNSYCADDGALLKISREDLEQDVPEEDTHLSLAGLEMHAGKWLDDSVLPSKTEAMFFPKQGICYEDCDPITGISPTHGDL
jgi:hypothetical protein